MSRAASTASLRSRSSGLRAATDTVIASRHHARSGQVVAARRGVGRGGYKEVGVDRGVDDDRVAAIVAIAPPLSMMPASDPVVPTLVLTPRHDQFCPPDVAIPIIATWSDCEFIEIESADHFLVGHTAAVTRKAATWLTMQF